MYQIYSSTALVINASFLDWVAQFVTVVLIAFTGFIFKVLMWFLTVSILLSWSYIFQILFLLWFWVSVAQKRNKQEIWKAGVKQEALYCRQKSNTLFLIGWLMSVTGKSHALIPSHSSLYFSELWARCVSATRAWKAATSAGHLCSRG